MSNFHVFLSSHSLSYVETPVAAFVFVNFATQKKINENSLMLYSGYNFDANFTKRTEIHRRHQIN